MSDPSQNASKYSQTGVNTQAAGSALSGLLKHILPTWDLNPDFPVHGGKGYYANVIDFGNGDGVAFCTDGVGTKIIVAELLGKYDSIGIDCVAMNVNDLICVGARPVSLVDYIACSHTDPSIFEAIGKGLAQGAHQAGISISGGEISQIKEIIQGIDLTGACIGHVKTDHVNTGAKVRPGDHIIGLESNGVHSNGLTLARRVLLGESLEDQKSKIDVFDSTLNTTLGLELLKPTRIYVNEVMEMLNSGLNLKAVAHITGGGFCNLNRVAAAGIRFVLNKLPSPQPIFDLIQIQGKVSQAEMYEVFNMGIGLCIIVEGTSEVDRVLEICHRHQTSAQVIGSVEACNGKEVSIPKFNLTGRDGSFNSS